MNYAITTLINVSIVGFALVMIFDFATGLYRLWVSVAVTETKGSSNGDTPDQKAPHAPQTLEIPRAIDLWMQPIALLEEEETCCCHSAIAPAPLLLAAGVGGTDQPDIATLGSSELRKLCQGAGIRWRNAHGTRHLSKGEMILALGS